MGGTRLDSASRAALSKAALVQIVEVVGCPGNWYVDIGAGAVGRVLTSGQGAQVYESLKAARRAVRRLAPSFALVEVRPALGA